MNTNKIIPREVQGQHCIKLLPLFRESIGQAGESPHLHSHGQVLALDVRSTNLAHIRVSKDGDLFTADALGGRIAGFTLGISGIQFNQLRKLYALRSQAENNGIPVRRESVRSDLETALSCGGQLFRKGYSISFRASAQVPSEHQLTVAFDGNKRVGITNRDFISPLFDFSLFLHSDVSPKLITLDVLDSHTVDAFVHQLLAFLARKGEKIQNGSRVNASYAGSGADGATLDQVLQNAHSFFFGQDHVAKRLWLWLYERLVALGTAISLLSFSVSPKLLSWDVAGLAGHFVSFSEQHKNIQWRKHCQEKSCIEGKKVFSGGIQ
jgi:hypothetical protein